MTPNNKIKPARALLLAAALLLPAAASALTSDRNQPIQIEADQGSLDQGNRSTEFFGNVVIQQGTMYIRAAKVRVVKAADGAQTMTASGSPVHFGQQLDRQGTVKGQAARVEYQSATGIVKLSGGAKLERGGDRASGDTITYNTRTEVYTVLGGSRSNANKGRVSITIQPQQK